MEERNTEDRKDRPKERDGGREKGRKRKEGNVKKASLSLYLIKYTESFALTKEADKYIGGN
jgi:hypothetical protein